MTPGEVCGRKRVFYTKTSARKAAKLARWHYRHPMYFYRCPCCGWWHLASHNRPLRKFIIKSAGLEWRQ